MGAWGSGAFENDDAVDWLTDLEENGVAAVEVALVDASRGEYIEGDVGSCGLAAAEAVAAALSGPASELPDAVLEAVAAHADELRALRESALQAVRRVGAAESELARLWEEAGDGQWRDGLRSLERRLIPTAARGSADPDLTGP